MMTVRKHAGRECIIRRGVFKAQHTIATDALQRLRTREGGMRAEERARPAFRRPREGGRGERESVAL